MANGSNSINFESSTGEALLAPFINLQAKYFEAELAGDTKAVNNLCESYKALATMTLNKAGGTAVQDLDALKTKIHSLCNQWVALQIDEMYTKDDDKIDNIRTFSREAIEEVKCVISRVIIKICTQSFSNTVMQGCTIKDPSKLAYNVESEFASAKQEVINTLVTLGLEIVALAVFNDGNIEDREEIVPAQKPQKNRCPTMPKNRCPTVKHFGSTCPDGKVLGSIRRS